VQSTRVQLEFCFWARLVSTGEFMKITVMQISMNIVFVVEHASNKWMSRVESSLDWGVSSIYGIILTHFKLFLYYENKLERCSFVWITVFTKYSTEYSSCKTFNSHSPKDNLVHTREYMLFPAAQPQWRHVFDDTLNAMARRVLLKTID